MPSSLWHATAALLPPTAEWTNKVELADLDGDARLDVVMSQGKHPTDAAGNETCAEVAVTPR